MGPLIGIFGEPVVYTAMNGSVVDIDGIFDEAYKQTDIAGGTGVTTELPMVGVRLSDMGTVFPVQGDHCMIRGHFYVVREVQIDGKGSAKLSLNWMG
jgi:hypothetical protein